MESIRHIFKIGRGPSSSHTMGPAKAARLFHELTLGACRYEVTLFGSLAATVQPYTYAWTGDRNDQTIDSLAAGLYFVTVTDANGCTASDSTEISEPEELTLTLITLTETCADAQTATIEVEAAGGTPEYAYNGCTADDAPAAVTTADELIALGLTLDDNCTPASELTVTHRDVVEGSCPIVINRYYKVADLCGNASAEFMQTLQVFDSVAPSVTVNALYYCT